MEFLFEWIAQYGYIALFLALVLGIVGLPIPDETLMVFCGYLISKGTLDPTATWLTAFSGSICGITVSYWLGRRFGLSVVRRYGRYFLLTEEKLAVVLIWYARIGHWILFIGYYIAGVRHFSAVVTGTSGVRWRSFAAYAYSGGALWVTTFLSLGYIVGENWQAIAARVHRQMAWAGTIAMVLALAVWLGYRHWNHRKKG